MLAGQHAIVLQLQRDCAIVRNASTHPEPGVQCFQTGCQCLLWFWFSATVTQSFRSVTQSFGAEHRVLSRFPFHVWSNNPLTREQGYVGLWPMDGWRDRWGRMAIRRTWLMAAVESGGIFHFSYQRLTQPNASSLWPREGP